MAKTKSVSAKKRATKAKPKVLEFKPFATPQAERKYRSELFAPSKEIRSLDLTKLQGMIVKAKLQHANEEKSDQFLSIVTPLENALGTNLHLSGWCGRYLGKPGATVTLKVQRAVLIGHMNGGRQSKFTPLYKDFFDEKYQKTLVLKKHTMSLEDKMTTPGMRLDFDRADVKVEFQDGLQIEALSFGIVAPKEWYSEAFEKLEQFSFETGFFETAGDAIDQVARERTDDLFGERYFPVAVFPFSVPLQDIWNVLSYPKSHSDAILLSDRVVFGTRCKPNEYVEFINEVYRVGGRIAKSMTWSWS